MCIIPECIGDFGHLTQRSRVIFFVRSTVHFSKPDLCAAQVRSLSLIAEAIPLRYYATFASFTHTELFCCVDTDMEVLRNSTHWGYYIYRERGSYTTTTAAVTEATTMAATTHILLTRGCQKSEREFVTIVDNKILSFQNVWILWVAFSLS